MLFPANADNNVDPGRATIDLSSLPLILMVTSPLGSNLDSAKL